MSRRDPRITLAQIRDAAEKARTLCASPTLDSLLADWKRRQHWSDASKLLAREYDVCQTNSSKRRDDIPWKEIAGTRDHLIHGYDLIDHRVLWDAVHIDIPRLIEASDELLA